MLYHKEVFWPHEFLDSLNNKIFNLKFSRHALEACLNDRYGTIIPPKQIKFDKNTAFEIELNNKNLNKIVIRINNGSYDLSLVLIPEYDYFFVKTLWRNEIGDTHTTLNRSLYSNSY